MLQVPGRRDKIRHILFICSILAFLILSCGGGDGPDPDPGSGSGQVALFLSDNISFYKQVVARIDGVHLVNSGTGDVCPVLRSPVTVDLSNLTNMAQYVDLATCPDGSYNRIDIEFGRDVHLMDQLDATSACVFTSYLDASGSVNALDCDQATGICRIGIPGGVRDVPYQVLEDQYTDLGIDFNLKEFTVTDFGTAACSVTMSAAKLSAADMNESGRAHGVSGIVTALDTAADTFTLMSTGASLTVRYGGILPALQPNIDALLLFAQSESLAATVLTGKIDITAGVLDASAVYLKVAGSVSAVLDQPVWSFDIAYASGKAIKGSHRPPADVQGVFENGTWINVKFSGYDQGKDEYIAAAIEVLPDGTVLED